MARVKTIVVFLTKKFAEFTVPQKCSNFIYAKGSNIFVTYNKAVGMKKYPILEVFSRNITMSN